MILASDLDNTLVHPLRGRSEGDGGSISIVEWLAGRPLSYMPTTGLVMLRQLASEHVFVVVTSRSRAQFERLSPIRDVCANVPVICANGATVLIGSVVDDRWRERLAPRLAAAAALPEAGAALNAEFGPPADSSWMMRVHTCDDAYWYAVCDPARIPADAIDRANDLLRPLGWLAVRHGRKIYALPAGLTKEAALAYVLEELRADRPLVCAGDSVLDQGFLAMADLALVPAGSPAALAAARSVRRVVEGSPVKATHDLLAAALDAAGRRSRRDGAVEDAHDEAAA